jgi:glycosyltransferase involved in cell wall biosynthesis
VKILFIHNRYKQFGGEDVAVEQEAALLLAKGHEVNTLLFENRNITGFFPKLKAASQSVYNFSSARKVKKAIKELKPDIIHVHNFFFTASPSVLFVSHRHKIPSVFTIHNYRLVCSNALLLRNNKVCELCISKKFPLHGIRYKCYHNSRSASALVTLITGIHKLFGT